MSSSLGIDRFGIEDGLPGLFVPDLEVTEDGRLWVLASGRLAAFDGLVFEEHEIAETVEWRGGSVVGIGAGRADTLWLTVGDRLFSHVRGHTDPQARHDLILRDVWQGEDSHVWAWDDRGLVRLGKAGFERMVLLERRDSLRLANEGPPGSALWLADTGGGPLRRIPAMGIVEPQPFPDAWPLKQPRFLVARAGNPFLDIADLEGRRIASSVRPDRAPMLLDTRGLLWTALPGKVEALDSAGEVVASLSLQPQARVTAVREDHDGNLWVGTVTDGLYRIRERPIRVLARADGLTDGQVLRISAADQGGVLILDQEGWVMRVGDTAVDTVFVPSADAGRATAALVDRSGTVWLGIIRDGEGTLVGRRTTGQEIRIPLPSLSPVRIVEDPFDDGLLWIIGGGVYRVHAYAPAGAALEGPLLPREWGGRDIVVDRPGAAWIAGPLGIARIDDGGAHYYLAGDGFPTGNARALLVDDDGTLWIGRYLGGLVRYEDGHFQEVRARDGLWDDVVSSLLADGAGNLWMGSNRGIHRVARAEVADFLDGRAEHVQGRGYGAAAGFVNPEASGWHGYRSPDGRLWFPTFSGVAVVDPVATLVRDLSPPGIRIRGVRAGEELLAGDSVRLARGQRRFDVAYGAIALSHPEGMRYEVLLEGVDPDWVDVGGQRQVTYGNVPAGRRVFRVRAVSGAGVASPREATLTLVVPPYFRETWGFYLLLSLTALLAAFSAHRLRTRQLRARELTLQRLVEVRTHDLARSQARTAEALATVAAQADELRSLDEAKSRFFANVSHELRTPLTLVQGPLQDVLDGRLGPTPDAVKEQVATVLASGRRLGELVEQLLDVARLEAGELKLNLRLEDLRPMFVRLALSFEALARSREISFQVRLPDGHIFALVDADQVEKVCANLLSNALKFTEGGGQVRFVVEQEKTGGEGDLVMCVEDNGVGIPTEQQKHIFERFQQVDASARRRHGGAGLGLALVKEITELHGGTVQVRSQPGRGSRFTVRLPSGPETGPHPVGSVAEAKGPAAVDPAVTDDPPPLATPPQVLTGEPPEDAQRPTVLVVEDHAELRAYLRRHLEDRYRVVEAVDGRAGLEKARRTVPDLVLCDIMMPGMDGEALCRAIRADTELSFLPVIMVSARASRGSRLSALGGGADDYLVKPFDPEELRLRLHNVLAARKRLRERFREEGRTLPIVDLELPRTGRDDDFGERFAALLRQHLGDEDFDVEAMGRALAMSRATLYRKTEEALGTAPVEFLWQVRLRQAAHWLQETDATVSEIAYACGFKTVPHFTRRFKDSFGTTPASYRDRSPGSEDPR